MGIFNFGTDWKEKASNNSKKAKTNPTSTSNVKPEEETDSEKIQSENDSKIVSSQQESTSTVKSIPKSDMTFEIANTESNSASEKKVQIEEVSEINTDVAEKTEEEKVIQPRKIVKICKPGTAHMREKRNNQDFVFSFLNIKAILDGCGSGKHSELGSIDFPQLFAREVGKFIECVSQKNIAKLVKFIKTDNFNNIVEQVKKGYLPSDAFLGIVNAVFERMLSKCDDVKYILENYLFTILICLEYEDEFVVYSCGDGFIIKEDSNGISFEKLDDGDYPAYYVYNWVDPSYLNDDYKDGVEFKVSRFSKAEYTNIGVSSDGLRFFYDMYETDRIEFLKKLSEGKTGQIERIINRNSQIYSGTKKFDDFLKIKNLSEEQKSQMKTIINGINQNHEIFKDDISICF